MIEIKQVKTQDEVNYTFVEKLMHTAFPQEERRDTVQQREYSDNNPRFCNNIILENGNSIGMISYWTMGDFYSHARYNNHDTGYPLIFCSP